MDKKELTNLVFGKNYSKRIVSIEPSGMGDCEIFYENKDGSITSEIVENKRFILFNKPQPAIQNVNKLKGNQHYKFVKSYTSNELFHKAIEKCNKRKIDIWTVRDPKESFMCRYGYTYYKGMDHKEVSILSIDIEDTYGIAKDCDPNGRLLLIANTFRNNGVIERKQFAYDDFKSEEDMLLAWSKWVRQKDPSIIVGHNLYGHDLKVIDYSARRYRVKLKLGRNKSEMYISKRDSQFRKDGSQSYSFKNIQIYGREIVDTWFLAMKYDQASRREYENYKLKYIIKFEGLEKEDRVHYDASNIHKDYKDLKKWKEIKKYNVHDSDDALAYFDLVIPVFFQYTKSIPRSFQNIINSATGSQINSLTVRSYLQLGHSISKHSEQIKYPGAISFGMPGIHKNVFKIDVQSLYPSIILTYKLIDKRKDPNENLFKILKYFTEQRIENKMKYEKTNDIKYKILSDSQKITINSIYGFYGASKLNYNNPKIAAKVTEIGREILLDSIEWATGERKIPEGALGNKTKSKKEDL